jgi:hypothetical protein
LWVGTWRNRGVTTAEQAGLPVTPKEQDHVPEQPVCRP